MNPDTKHRLEEWMHNARTNVPRWFIALSLVLLLAVNIVAAQSVTVTFSDDFEDGDSVGWEGSNIAVVTDSAEGTYSLRHTDGITDHSQKAEWRAGPFLDLQEDFLIEGTVKNTYGTGNLRNRVGIMDNSTPPQGAMLTFSAQYNQTYLSVNGTEDPQTANLDTVSNIYPGTWVNFKIASTERGVVKAKVWEYGTPEPDNYQLTRDFGQEAGYLSIDAGITDEGRTMWLDSVSIEGQEATDPNLSLDTRNFMRHGTRQYYNVSYSLNTTGVGNKTIDVTDNATVESLDQDAVTVDNQTHELVATENESVNKRAAIRATYNGSVAYKEVTVATSTMDNLEVLPPMWRINATFGSSTIQAILVALFAGIIGARFSTAFGGLALMQLMMVAAWFTGYAQMGVTMISLFAALFIGLNMAANIDYTVRTG